MIVAGAISVLADDRSGSNVKVLLPIAVAFAILALIAEQRRKARRAAHNDGLAVSHGLFPDANSAGFPIGVFDRIPENSTVSNMLRHGARPQELVGFLITFPQSRATVTRTVGAHRSAARRPHLTLIQEVRAVRQDRKGEIEIGDVAFDERWVVKCESPAYAAAVLTPALRTWLMTLDADKVTPVLEARDGDVVAVIDGEHLDRIPELLDMAETLARHLGTTRAPRT